MISSIFIDFCDGPPDQCNLIDEIIVKHFMQDLVDLSTDRVPNVRLSLAEAFYTLHKKIDKLELKED